MFNKHDELGFSIYGNESLALLRSGDTHSEFYTLVLINLLINVGAYFEDGEAAVRGNR